MTGPKWGRQMTIMKIMTTIVILHDCTLENRQLSLERNVQPLFYRYTASMERKSLTLRALRHCTQKCCHCSQAPPWGDEASQKASRLESTNMLSHEDDKAPHQTHAHTKGPFGMLTMLASQWTGLGEPNTHSQWTPSCCHGTKNISWAMPDRGAVTRPSTGFKIK